MGRGFIGALASETGVPIKTIRYYEDVGLLPRPPRTASGYRLYAPGTGGRLEFIRRAQGLGLRLEEIRDILDLTDRGRCPCGHVQRVLTSKLEELREKITDLRTLERRLRHATARGCPPRFRPRGRARCPTIDRQRMPKGRSR